MTAIRDRRSDPDTADDTPVPWDERSVIGSRRGIPWWAAVLVAFGLAAIGAVVNQQVSDGLSVLFHVCYVVGSLAAVTAVQRRGLFGTMVQPPLVMAITVPAVVLTSSGLPEGSDMLSKALAIGTPLINSFPVMALTTGATVVIGIVRMSRQRDPEARGKTKTQKSRKSGKKDERDDDDRTEQSGPEFTPPGENEGQARRTGGRRVPPPPAKADRSGPDRARAEREKAERPNERPKPPPEAGGRSPRQRPARPPERGQPPERPQPGPDRPRRVPPRGGDAPPPRQGRPGRGAPDPGGEPPRGRPPRRGRPHDERG